MSKFIDLTGKRYNHLFVIEKDNTKDNGNTYWKCKCDCGNFTSVSGKNLKANAVKSCGCLRKTAPNKTHGLSNTREYRKWVNIKKRCYDPSYAAYKNYGGRGIKMCDQWHNSFEAFYKWIKEHRTSDDQSIDRIDNNGDYSPDNCRMTDAKVQANNRRMCHYYSHDGKTQTLMQWCEELGLDYKRTHNRIFKLGWDFEKAISVPVDINKRNTETRIRKGR